MIPILEYLFDYKINTDLKDNYIKTYRSVWDCRYCVLDILMYCPRVVCSQSFHHLNPVSHSVMCIFSVVFFWLKYIFAFCRKALIWQKRYLLVTLHGDSPPGQESVFLVTKDFHLGGQGRFRSAVHTVIAVIRYKYAHMFNDNNDVLNPIPIKSSQIRAKTQLQTKTKRHGMLILHRVKC